MNYPDIDNSVPVESEQDQPWFIFEVAEDALRRISFGAMAFYLVAFVVIVMTYYATAGGTPVASIRPQVAVYFFILTVYMFRRLAHNRANILAPDVVFLVFFTVFHQGYLFFYSIGTLPYLPFVFVFPSTIPESLLVVNLGFLGYLMGYELSAPWSEQAGIQRGLSVPTQGWGIFGIAFMVLGFSMHFSVIAIVGISAFQEMGYRLAGGMREYAGSLTIIWDNSLRVIMFGTILYCLHSSLRYGRLFVNKWVVIFPAMFIIFVALEGDRGPILYMGAPMLLIRHYFVKPIKWRWLIVITLVTLFTFSFLSVVRKIAIAPTEMVRAFVRAKETGEVHWTDSFVEMGSNFRTVNMTTYLVPGQEPYWRGKSWVGAVIHSVPYLEGLAVRLGVFRVPSPGMWLTHTMFGPGASGTGFSCAGEGYLNFGFAGAFLEVFLIGVLMRKILVYFARNPSPVSAFVLLGVIGPLFRIPRAHIHSVTPFLFQVIVISIFLKIFFGVERAEGVTYLDEVSAGDFGTKGEVPIQGEQYRSDRLPEY